MGGARQKRFEWGGERKGVVRGPWGASGLTEPSARPLSLGYLRSADLARPRSFLFMYLRGRSRDKGCKEGCAGVV